MRHEGGGGQLHAFQGPRALEEERELAHGQLDAASASGFPEQREAPLLEPLLIDAEPGPIPDQHLGAGARPIREEEEMSRERIPPELARDERRESVVARPQVGGLGIRPHPQRARAADHASLRNSSAASGTDNPSTR